MVGKVVCRPGRAAAQLAGVGGVVAGLIVWALQKYVFKTHMDPTVSAEIYAVVPGLISAGLAWVAGRLTPHRDPAKTGASPSS